MTIICRNFSGNYVLSISKHIKHYNRQSDEERIRKPLHEILKRENLTLKVVVEELAELLVVDAVLALGKRRQSHEQFDLGRLRDDLGEHGRQYSLELGSGAAARVLVVEHAEGLLRIQSKLALQLFEDIMEDGLHLGQLLLFDHPFGPDLILQLAVEL